MLMKEKFLRAEEPSLTTGAEYLLLTPKVFKLGCELLFGTHFHWGLFMSILGRNPCKPFTYLFYYFGLVSSGWIENRLLKHMTKFEAGSGLPFFTLNLTDIFHWTHPIKNVFRLVGVLTQSWLIFHGYWQKRHVSLFKVIWASLRL